MDFLDNLSTDNILQAACVLAAVVFVFIILKGRGKAKKPKAGAAALPADVVEKLRAYLGDLEAVAAEINAPGWTIKSFSFYELFKNRERLTEQEVAGLKSVPDVSTAVGLASAAQLVTLLAKFLGSKYHDVTLTRKQPTGLPEQAEFYFDFTNLLRFLKAFVDKLEGQAVRR